MTTKTKTKSILCTIKKYFWWTKSEVNVPYEGIQFHDSNDVWIFPSLRYQKILFLCSQVLGVIVLHLDTWKYQIIRLSLIDMQIKEIQKYCFVFCKIKWISQGWEMCSNRFWASLKSSQSKSSFSSATDSDTNCVSTISLILLVLQFVDFIV
jgi:hypothetical protein